MKYLIAGIFLVFFISACDSEPGENQMIVEGNVQGLKKGTLYLQHVPDSVLTTVDSMEVEGDGRFRFETELQSPEIYYLYLKKADNNEFNDRITFFGEPGLITINTTWNTFQTKADIQGSETQLKLEQYNEVMSKFHSKSLELVRIASDPAIQADSIAMDSIQKLSDKTILRGYLYTLNFAMNNSDSYIAPYLALTEVADANPKYLDSIYNALDPNIAGSKYGLRLEEYLKEIPRN
ncbi:MAG: DUF4369 domain-containing protein [Flavobacteriaceae bacterium]